MDVDGALDALYAEPLDNFTSLRNSLAADVKKAGGEDAARAIKSLKKPSVGAWTINQLVRRHPSSIEELLEVRQRLETAGSPQELRELSKRRRELVAELAALAKEVLEESGQSASHATVDKVSQGLLMVASEEERVLLQRGRLTREPSSSGLEAFGFEASADDAVPDTARAVPLKTQRDVQKLRREAERLQQESARLEKEAAIAEAQARRSRGAADEAARAAARAVSMAEDAARAAGL